METATFSGRRGIAYRRAVPARVPGWRLVLDKPGIVPVGHGFANIVPDDAAAVLGVLYEIRTVELDHLDLSEGVLIGNYRRGEVVAETLTSRATKGRGRAGSVAARSISRRACANSAATSAGTRAVVHPAIIRGSTPRAQRAAARGSVSDRQQRLR